MRRSVAEILFGQQQERLAIHFERVALDGPQRKLVFRPLEPLGYVISAPVNRLQACWRAEGREKRPCQLHRWDKAGGDSLGIINGTETLCLQSLRLSSKAQACKSLSVGHINVLLRGRKGEPLSTCFRDDRSS